MGPTLFIYVIRKDIILSHYMYMCVCICIYAHSIQFCYLQICRYDFLKSDIRV